MQQKLIHLYSDKDQAVSDWVNLLGCIVVIYFTYLA